MALIPSRSFEGEDPHVVAAIGAGGKPIRTVLIPSYGAIDVYCPAAGAVDPGSLARDSADGCRYIRLPHATPPAE